MPTDFQKSLMNIEHITKKKKKKNQILGGDNL